MLVWVEIELSWVVAELGKYVGNFQNFAQFIKPLESINDMQLKRSLASIWTFLFKYLKSRSILLLSWLGWWLGGWLCYQNKINDNYDIRYFMSFIYLRYIKKFKDNQNRKVKPLVTNRVIKNIKVYKRLILFEMKRIRRLLYHLNSFKPLNCLKDQTSVPLEYSNCKT